ncbi:MAG: autotransporter domain-containing protein [Pseudomonadota bacterium]
MKNLLPVLLLCLCLFSAEAFSDINITSPLTEALDITGDTTINVTGSGSLVIPSSSPDYFAIKTLSNNVTLNVNTTSASDGIFNLNESQIGLYSIFESSAESKSLTVSVTSGTMSASADPIIGLFYDSVAEKTVSITIGQDSGASATVSSIGDVSPAVIIEHLSNETDANGSLSVTINNKATGTISASGLDAYGIYLYNDISGILSSNITNAGTISVANGDAFYLNGNYITSNITNSGTIIGDFSNAEPTSTSTYNITNTGIITGNITFGIDSDSSLNLNGGSVTGNVTMGNSDQQIIFAGGSLTGSINGPGQVGITASTVSNGNIGNTTAISSLSVDEMFDINTHNNSINSAEITVLNSGTISIGSGSITASGSFMISGNAIFNDSETTINVGTFSTNSGSSLALTVSDTAATSISVVGAAVLSANTTLKLTLSGTIASGTVITLLDATSSSEISTIPDANVNINSSGTNIYGGNSFSTSVLGNKLLLTAAAYSSTLTLSDSNNQNASNAITGATSATGNLATIKAYLSNNSYSSAQKEEAVKSTTAAVDNSTNRVAFNNIATTSNIISARLESVRNNNFSASITDLSFVRNLTNQNAFTSSYQSTLNPLRDNNIKPSYPVFITLSGNEPSAKSAMWIQTFGSKIAQGNTSDGDGYNANSSGVMIGADHNFSKNFIVGLSSGYSKSSISARNAFKSTSIDTYQAMIYTGYDAKAYFLNTSLGIAVNNYNSDRYISLTNSSAKANYSGNSYTARAEVGSNYNFPNDIIFTPSFTITAARNIVNSYDENGAGTLNLHVKTDSTNFFEGRLGGELSQLFTTKAGTPIRPLISTSYGYDFAGNKQKSTSNFIGQNTTFASSGSRVAQGSFKLGTGVSFYTKKNVTVSVNYGLERRSDYIAHSGWLRMGWKF